MNKDINNLIFSIRNAIKNYSEGTLSPQEAETEYDKLLHRYYQIRETEKSELGSGFIKGICYNHNIENFSIFSGLYMYSENEFDLMFYYGDDRINTKIIDTLNNNKKRIDKLELSKIPPEENSLLSQTIYLYPILNSFKYNIFFIALSSSEYFSLDKFTFIGVFFYEIFNSSILKQNPININYYEDTIDKIVDFLSENINEAYSVAVHLFSLKLVKEIFFHMGTSSLLEISDSVLDTLKKNFPANSYALALSLNEYIVLTPLMRKSKSDPLKGKLEFEYKGISIQHRILQRKIDSTDSIFKLLSEINQFKYDTLNRNR